MGASERVIQYLEFKGISKYKFCKDLDFSNKFLDNSSNMGTDKACKILHYYPEINPEWLLTGMGSMLKNTNSDGYKTIYWRDDETGENVATDINESRYIHTEKQLDPPDTGHYKELAAARLEIIEGLKFKVATLEKELYVLKLTQGDHIVNEIVAQPAPELIVEKHK